MSPSRRSVAAVILLVVSLSSLVPRMARAQLNATSPSSAISLEDRAMMAARIYHIVSTFFPGLGQEKFDQDYKRYLATVLASDDRRAFDLASMELVAELHDGHSWFYDTWLDQTSAEPIGLLAYPLSGRWTVIRTQLDSVHIGDVITAIDNQSIDDFFSQNRRYISASSDRDAGLSLFDTPVIFPEKFTISLADGRHLSVDRKNDKKSPMPAPATEGRWLVEKSVAYIKIPTFHGIHTQAQALDFLRQFHDAKAVILDVRGNPGLGDPGPLLRALMDRPYQAWTDSTSEHGGALLRNYGPGYPGHSSLTLSDTLVTPREPAYSGRLILLTDRVCSCACEDFVMPFKYAKRATLVGETTAGTFSMTRHVDYPNGMILNISAVRHTFPDGSRFEGVGIVPDVPVDTSPEDLRTGRDPVLQKAIALAQLP